MLDMYGKQWNPKHYVCGKQSTKKWDVGVKTFDMYVW